MSMLRMMRWLHNAPLIAYVCITPAFGSGSGSAVVVAPTEQGLAGHVSYESVVLKGGRDLKVASGASRRVATRLTREPISRPQSTARLADLKQAGRLSVTATLVGTPGANVQDKTVVVAATAILPGLPSPMVAVVDPADARVLAPPHEVGQAAVKAAVAHQPLLSSQPMMLLHPGVDASSPISIAASILPADQTEPGGLLLPFDQHVGAAAFRRENLLMVVFDSSKPVDLAPIADDPVFGAASYSLLASGAVMTLTLPRDAQVEMLRKPDGWLVEVSKSGRENKAIHPEGVTGDVALPVLGPGHVVVVDDPVYKTDLLVGTVRQDSQNMPLLRHASDYILDQTLLGVVVERFSDGLDMRVTSSSFVINGRRDRSFLEVGHGHSDKLFFSRILDLPPVDDAELERRYKTALATAAATPIANRRLLRLDAAEAALALGQAREAGLLATIADQDAPAGPQSGRAAFLRAVAAVLDEQPDARSLLEDPRIPTSDEVMTWRAIDLATREPGNADAARTIWRCLPMITSYPEHLRDQILGRVALSLVSGGGPGVVSDVQGLRGDGKVRLAQAMILQRDGEGSRALAAFDALAGDADPAVVFAAFEKALGLRLKSGQVKPKQAADLLDAQALNARMAGEELTLKLQVASLRAREANWPAALGALREIVASSPSASKQVTRTAADILEQMVGANKPALPPSDVGQLSLIESNLDLLQEGADRAKISVALARRFSELDLPSRAAALVEGVIPQTPAGVERAQLGLELARLRLDQDDPAGTAAALTTTAAPDLPTELSDARKLIEARADEAGGQVDAALAALGPLRSAEADDLRASALAAKHDWQGQAGALASVVALQVPATGPLSGSMEDLVLRLVAATAHAGDREALRQLATGWGPRFRADARLDMLHLLTSDRVRSEGDLARSAAELSVSQSALSTLATAASDHGG